MERLKIDILGLSEVHWTGNGFFNSSDHIVYYSGHESLRRRGVGFIVHKNIARAVEGFQTINDRVMAIRINGKPHNTTIIQVYAPTTVATEVEVEDFYRAVQEVIDHTPKKDILYIIGDFNAKVGEGVEADIVGHYALGERNESGDRLVQFCQEQQMTIKNTFFQQPKRRLYTWTSPSGSHHNQIDYILCHRRWKSSILAVKTFPGADCGSDHELLVAKVKLRFCNVKHPPVARKFDVEKIPSTYAVAVKNSFSLLHTEGQPDELWDEIKTTIIETAQQHVPYKKPGKPVKWITDETIALADRRRRAKAVGDKVKVRELNTLFQRAARKDKERYWNGLCDKIEDDNRKGYTGELFNQVKKARTPFIARKATIRGADGTELLDQQAIRDRWRTYTEQLYTSDDHGLKLQEDSFELEPDILDEEVVWAIQQLTTRKAPGIDGIPAELLKPVPTAALTTLCQSIWKTCRWPKEWKRSVFVPIPKKGDTKDCSNYRTIALIPHASKILLKIIQQRLSATINREMPDVQAGFRRGRGTRDHIANLRWLMERAQEYRKDLYMCFIDYTKAFDCIEHEKLWTCLLEMGAPVHLVHLIKSLYVDQEAVVSTAYGYTEWLTIGKGTRQGCILSPTLFNLYAEAVIRKAIPDDTKLGVKIGGRIINNLRYADDTTLLTESREDLEKLILQVKEESEKVGLRLNIKKTKVMTTSGNDSCSIKIHNEDIETVQDYIFLGSKIVRTGDITPELKRRLALGRNAMVSMNTIWKSRNISIATKTRLVNSIIFPIATYGCETWTLKKSDRRKIDVFELWCWRRLLRIPWTARITNKDVLERIKPKTSLESKVTKLKLTFFGHVMRGNSLEKDLMLGMVSGSRRRGRPRTRWLDTVKSDTKMNMGELKQAVINRSDWRGLIHRMTENRPRLNG